MLKMKMQIIHNVSILCLKKKRKCFFLSEIPYFLCCEKCHKFILIMF